MADEEDVDDAEKVDDEDDCDVADVVVVEDADADAGDVTSVGDAPDTEEDVAVSEPVETSFISPMHIWRENEVTYPTHTPPHEHLRLIAPRLRYN